MPSARPIVDFAQTARPVFVVGMERGGTSIIYKTLSTAPCFGSVLGNQETFIFDDPLAVMSDNVRYMTREYIGGPERLNEFRTWFKTLTDWPPQWRINRRIVTAFFFFVAQQNPAGTRLIEKTPRHAFLIDLMVRFFPKCRIIGIHRHPFGVVESYRSRLKREIEMGNSVESYGWLDRTPQQICSHIEKIVTAMYDGQKNNPRKMMIVSYEELLRDPAFVFGAIAKFADVNGIEVKVAAPPSTGNKPNVDPLLKADGIVTGNIKDSSLTLDEKLALLEEFPALFAAAASITIAPTRTAE